MPDGKTSLLDLKNLTEPVSKLIEAVSSGIGVLYEPTRIRRKAKAEADASIILAKANAKTKAMAQRAIERLSYVELRRQRNIDAIVNSAYPVLPDTVDTMPVNEDWIVQFFDFCKDIGNEEMQRLWAKLLAGEVAHPGTFSPRTLHALKTMRREDAETFAKFCSFIWKVDNLLLVRFRIGEVHEIAKNEGLDSLKLTQLDNLGLVKYSYFTNRVSINENFEVTYFEKKYLIEASDDVSLSVSSDILTDIGTELFPICNPVHNEAYHNAVLEYFKKGGAKVSIL
jgi:uncharacterized repeat protein (TIGR03899 family)